DSAEMRCRDVNIPVALMPGQPANQEIFAEFCLPRGRTPQTVQLLVHGTTYNHTYWDFRYQPPKYSYVNAAVRAGYAILAIDRIGDGQSSHPPSSQIVFPNTIYTLHQVVDDLRNGTLGTKFDFVIEVGHSLGSSYTVDEQSTYQDADALILTGYGHQVSSSFQKSSGSTLYPAVDDPKFANSGLDAGYHTTKPGEIGRLYFHLPGADPSIVALNEKLKDTVELAEGQRLPEITKLSPNVRVPTLIFTGQHDIVYCNADDCSTEQSFYQAESPYFTSAACLRTMVMPNTGHDVALHYSAPESDRLILDWARETLPPSRFENDGHASNGPGPVGQLPDGHAARCHGTGPLVTSLPELATKER
ncbi:MAG: alpha/beta hydrolase, partial [Mycobacterium sp.]|nr:alpha/beta hydrolase [Mycobacterium sp.]